MTTVSDGGPATVMETTARCDGARLSVAGWTIRAKAYCCFTNDGEFAKRNQDRITPVKNLFS